MSSSRPIPRALGTLSIVADTRTFPWFPRPITPLMSVAGALREEVAWSRQNFVLTVGFGCSFFFKVSDRGWLLRFNLSKNLVGPFL